MTASPPIVYLLVGQDEFAINLELAGMEARLGDPATASLNVTRLDGRTFNTDELLATASAAPFLARRRLFILENPTARIAGEPLGGQDHTPAADIDEIEYVLSHGSAVSPLPISKA